MAYSAFTPFSRTERAEAQPLVQPGPFNLTVQATANIRAWCRPKATQGDAALDKQKTGWEAGASSLSDGRLNVGTHLPLLAKRYRYLGLIGEGTSAQVLLAQDMLHPKQELIAIKVLKRHYSYVGQKEARLARWLSSVAPLAGVAQVKDFFVFASHMCLVMPQLQHSVLDLIVQSSDWPTEAVVQLVRHVGIQLLATLADLHAHGLVHADLKPENILLPHIDPGPGGRQNLAMGLRLIDLGTCFNTTTLDTSQLSVEAQSLPYRAPEVVMQRPCGTPMDMWSFGCIIAELLLHQPLFPADSSAQLISRVRETLAKGQAAGGSAGPSLQSRNCLIPRMGKLESWLDKQSPLQLAIARVDMQAADLVMKLLKIESAQRLTAAEALQHPFFSELLPFRHMPSIKHPLPKTLTVKAEALGALQPAPAVLPAAQATLSETSGSLAHIMASSAAGTEAPESSNAAQRPPATPRRIRKPAPSVRQVRVSPAKLTGTSGQAVAHVRSKQHTENRGEGAFNQQGAELSSRERGAMPASHPASPSDPKRQEAAAGLQASPFQAGSEPLQRPAAAEISREEAVPDTPSAQAAVQEEQRFSKRWEGSAAKRSHASGLRAELHGDESAASPLGARLPGANEELETGLTSPNSQRSPLSGERASLTAASPKQLHKVLEALGRNGAWPLTKDVAASSGCKRSARLLASSSLPDLQATREARLIKRRCKAKTASGPTEEDKDASQEESRLIDTRCQVDQPVQGSPSDTASSRSQGRVDGAKQLSSGADQQQKTPSKQPATLREARGAEKAVPACDKQPDAVNGSRLAGSVTGPEIVADTIMESAAGRERLKTRYVEEKAELGFVSTPVPKRLKNPTLAFSSGLAQRERRRSKPSSKPWWIV